MDDMMKKMSMLNDEGREDSSLEAKMEVLKELHDMMSQILEGDLDSMGQPEEEESMEVEVKAEDPEGLQKGLETAQKLMDKKNKLM